MSNILDINRGCSNSSRNDYTPMIIKSSLPSSIKKPLRMYGVVLFLSTNLVIKKNRPRRIAGGIDITTCETLHNDNQ